MIYFLIIPNIKRQPYHTKPIQMILVWIITGLSRACLNRCESPAVAVVPVLCCSLGCLPVDGVVGFMLGCVIATIDTCDDQAASFLTGLVKNYHGLNIVAFVDQLYLFICFQHHRGWSGRRIN